MPSVVGVMHDARRKRAVVGRCAALPAEIFAIVADQADPPTVSLKCDPDVAFALRGANAGVNAGHHLNKRHWNTVTIDGAIPDEDVLGWVDDSYDLVVDGLPRAVRLALRSGGGSVP